MYRTTLQVPNRKPFLVKRLTVTKSQLNLWNLRLFQMTATSRSKDKKTTIPAIEQLDATNIDFDFGTPDKRSRFEAHFKFVLNDRRKQIEQFKTGRKVAASQAHKLVHNQTYTAPAPRRDFVATASESTCNELSPTKSSYVLNAITRFPAIDLNNSDVADPDKITSWKNFG
jgi:hypothetical protein